MRSVYRQLKAAFENTRHRLLAMKLREMGTSVMVDASARLDYPDRITLGDRVRVNHCAVLRANSDEGITLSHDSVVQDFSLLNANEGFIELGERSWLGAGSHIYGNGGVTIGADVLIAAQTVINTVSHHADDLTRPINDQGIYVDPVVIEDDVWIGTGARIMQGVTIGRGAIVGANSLVNRDVPGGAIVYGTPARIASRRTHANKTKQTAENRS